MTLWLKYKHNMTTNKHNQYRVGKLSTHNIFYQVSCVVMKKEKKEKEVPSVL